MASILLIEDDRFLSDLYQSSINQAGFNVQVAQDAQMAVDLLDEYGADLILLDLLLPAHNGIEVLQELQSHSDWQSIPVVILSSQLKESIGLSTSKWKEYGVVDYLYKPEVTPQDVIDTIKTYLP